jgi:capsular exopolysaccharide synthesis family protein
MPNQQFESSLHFLDYWRVVRIRWPFIVLVFLTVVLTAGITTYFSPKQYAASAKVEIRRGDFLMQIFNRFPASSGSMGPERGDPRFLTTQFEVIQTKEVLYPVIHSLNLVQRWSNEGVSNIGMAYARLRGMLQVRDIRNTDLIQITVFSTNPELAAEIANAIAEQYKQVRIKQVEDWVNRSLVTLQSEVEKQRAEVERLRKKAADIREKYGIIDLNPDQVATAQQAGDQVYLGIENTVSTERMKVASLRSRYEQISSLTDDQILRSMATLQIDDPVLLKLFPEYQSLAAEEARLLNAGLGPRHPTILALRGTKNEIQRQIDAQIAAMRSSLSNQLRIAEESLRALEKELEAAKSQQQGTKTQTVEYIEAKQAYIQALALLEAAEQRLSTERMQLTMPQSPAIVWEKAEPSNTPVRPKVLLNMILAVVVGLVLGIGSAFFLEYLDTSVKTLEEVESNLGLPVLAVIPRNMRVLPKSKAIDVDCEAYRILRTNVEFNRKNPEANTFAIVSGGPGEGKSTTIANLAFSFSEAGYNTLIIDADLRRPIQHKIFSVENDAGLADCLSKGLPLEEAVKVTQHENLFVMPSGNQPSDVVALLSSHRMGELLAEVKQRFDVVFLDSPPILGVSDASVLASIADLTIIVVQHRRFPKTMLNRVKNAIENVGGTVLGVVLNNVDIRHDQNYEYYTNYYNYYLKPSRDSSKLRTTVPAKNSRSDIHEEGELQAVPSETETDAAPAAFGKLGTRPSSLTALSSKKKNFDY